MEAKSSNNFYNCQHSSNLLRKLNDLRDDLQLSDVALICNGECIRAHKNVLAAASPYFLAMFSGRFPESAKKEIVLYNVDPEGLSLLVNYMYTGCLKVNAANAQTVLATASFLQIEWVEECCVHYMADNLEPTSCLGLIHFAEAQSNRALLNAAKDFAIKHFRQVMRCDEFLDLTCDDLLPFLSSDGIFMHSEDALLVGLLRWVEHRPDERLQCLPLLLSHLHPACVSEAVVSSTSLLTADERSSKWRNSVLDCSSSREWSVFVLDKMGRNPDLSRFDLSFGTLTSLKPLPHKAFAISLVGHKNVLYVQGGCVGRNRRAGFYYNIYRDLWHALPPLLVPRSHHRSLVVGEMLYAFGGNSTKGATSSVECLDLETGTAMHVKNMLAQRSSMGAAVADKCAYVMGGETDNRSLHSMERFDPREGNWCSLAYMSVVNSYCSSAVIGDHIYCCQGLGSSMERYDVRVGRWEFIDFSDEREFYEIFSVDNNLYSVSGVEMSRYFVEDTQWRTVYEFNSAREWDTAAGMHVTNYSI